MNAQFWIGLAVIPGAIIAVAAIYFGAHFAWYAFTNWWTRPTTFTDTGRFDRIEAAATAAAAIACARRLWYIRLPGSRGMIVLRSNVPGPRARSYWTEPDKAYHQAKAVLLDEFDTRYAARRAEVPVPP